MYKCEECGTVFEWPRQWREPHGERRSGCPVCASAYQAACVCLQCGRALLWQEQYHGYCRSCLMQTLAQEADAALAEVDVCLLYETALQKRR